VGVGAAYLMLRVILNVGRVRRFLPQPAEQLPSFRWKPEASGATCSPDEAQRNPG